MMPVIQLTGLGSSLFEDCRYPMFALAETRHDRSFHRIRGRAAGAPDWRRQALVMGFSDTFAVIGAVLVLASLAVLLTRKARGAAAGAR
jgi:hypothetical protein